MEWMLMPIRRYFDFSGRSRRMEYWMWVVFQFLIGIAFWILMFVVAGTAIFAVGAGMESKDPSMLAATGAGVGIGMFVLLGLYALVGLFLLIPSLAVAVRRLHDTNRSGWWLLAPIGCECIVLVATMLAAGAAVTDPQRAMVPGLIALIAGLAAMVLALILLVFMFLDGTPGPNRYGADPKGRVEASTFA